MTIEKPGLLQLSTGDWVDPHEVDGINYLPWEQSDGGWTRSHMVRICLKSGLILTFATSTQAAAYALRDRLASEIQAGLARPTTITLPS
jgi:hypothetical protein